MKAPAAVRSSGGRPMSRHAEAISSAAAACAAVACIVLNFENPPSSLAQRAPSFAHCCHIPVPRSRRLTAREGACAVARRPALGYGSCKGKRSRCRGAMVAHERAQRRRTTASLSLLGSRRSRGQRTFFASLAPLLCCPCFLPQLVPNPRLQRG